MLIVACSPAVFAEDTTNQPESNASSQAQENQQTTNTESIHTEKPLLKNEESVDAWMPDPVLQQAVAQKLQIADPASITKDDMKRLTSLSFTEDQQALSSLQGLEYAENFYYLYIPKSQVKSIEPLANLKKMSVLYIMYSQVADIEPLRGLSEMRNLHLDANPIADYSPIASLTKLQEFGCRYNNIQDASFLSHSPGLKFVYLWENKISDVSFIQNLDQLQVLELSYNQLDDNALPLIAQKSQLIRLYLSGNELTTTAGLDQLTLLQNLTLNKNHIRDLSPLGGLPNLINADARFQTITLDEVTASESFWQTSPVINAAGATVPIAPAAENEAIGTPQDANILWTDLEDAGQVTSTWDDPSLGSKFYFSGTITQGYKRQQEAAPVTVKFEDEAGNSLADAQILTGKMGETYQTTAKSISGWRLKETPSNAAGQFSAEPQEVIYLYEKEAPAPEDQDSDQETPSDDQKPASVDQQKPTGAAASVVKQANEQPSKPLAQINKSLPKTGDQQNSLSWILGSVLILTCGVWLRKRS
ncbi:MucBP domain-containing protein [Listeria costaricensis]|uniref:MucBP domain-containing protein n=1 Tax=Listeria costaricensis TaxID=2026604 RepID=UPI000C08C712|nr:MucBP domain-containing protein [Listeria costaricensis]